MINHGSATPKYIQLAEELEQQINKGIIKADERLYSENELCKKYDVSRITVRQAFRLLESKDLIYTVYGKGTFVKMPLLSQSLPEIVSFSKMLSLKGLEGSTKIKSYHMNIKNEKAQKALRLSEDDNLFNLNLLGCVENSPVALYQSFFSPALGERMETLAREMSGLNVPFTTLDLYKKTDIKLSHVEQSISAENLDSKLSSLFGLPCGTALVVLQSVFYDESNTPVEYKIGRYRSDIYSFKMTRTLK